MGNYWFWDDWDGGAKAGAIFLVIIALVVLFCYGLESLYKRSVGKPPKQIVVSQNNQ